MVRPIMFGRTMERRDQVLIGFLLFVASASSHLLRRGGVDEQAFLDQTGHDSVLYDYFPRRRTIGGGGSSVRLLVRVSCNWSARRA